MKLLFVINRDESFAISDFHSVLRSFAYLYKVKVILSMEKNTLFLLSDSQRLHPRAVGTHAVVGRSKLRPILPGNRPRLARCLRRGNREIVHDLLVHRRIRPLQGGAGCESLRCRPFVRLRGASSRAHERQMRASTFRAEIHRRSKVPGSRLPTDLLRRG